MQPKRAARSERAVLPWEKPADWDPLAFNRKRGNAGAIPASYLSDINGPDGDTKHVGKHLPYVPQVASGQTPKGFLALMWGDPKRGYARHPNAVRSAANKNQGHWYDWIKIRKATRGQVTEMRSTYSSWPTIGPHDNGAYAAFGGGEVTADKGRNTIYFAALPPDVAPGDTLRVWAHCLTHGEYVDFITL